MLKKITIVSLSGIASILSVQIAIAQSRISYVAPTPRIEKPKATQVSTSRGCPHSLNGLVELLTPSRHVGLTVSARPTLLFKLT
ncbi:MAG: hypothetical protein HC820_05695, partial [Hydrococcus sp. RM1_1_31]|nr:hypothetical protein [Hydrococcus sp. RM1_1_31]